jgi:hypothetical protein
VNVKLKPGLVGNPYVTLSAGNAENGSAGLLLGQLVMKAAASVYAAFRIIALPYGFAGATSPMAKRCNDAWMASVSKMAPATLR